MAAKLYEITHPDGYVERVSNMSAFCKQHGLTRAGMSKVVNGTTSHHQSYTARIVSAMQDSKFEMLEKRKNAKIVQAYVNLVKTPYSKLTLEQKNDFVLTMYAIHKIFEER